MTRATPTSIANPGFQVGVIVRSGSVVRIIARVTQDMLMLRNFGSLGAMSSSHCYSWTFAKNLKLGSYVPVNFHTVVNGIPIYSGMDQETAFDLATRVRPKYRDLLTPMQSLWRNNLNQEPRRVLSMRQGHVQHESDLNNLAIVRSSSMAEFLSQHTRIPT